MSDHGFSDDDLAIADSVHDDRNRDDTRVVIQQAHDIAARGAPGLCHHTGVFLGDDTLRKLHDYLVSEGADCPGMPT